MSGDNILPIAVLFSVVCNLCDLLVTRGGGFLRIPNSGFLGRVAFLWAVLLFVTGLLHIVGIIPAVYSVILGSSGFVFLQGYSIFDRHRKIKVPGNSSQSTWSPFQSPEVREICAHLTSSEHARLIADAHQRGADIGRWIAFPFAVAVGFLGWSWQFGLVLLAFFGVYFAVSGLPRLRAMRRRSMELLCETEWARDRGYKPERLRLMAFPWSR